MRLLLVTTAKHILSTVARVVAGCCQISSAANPVRSALYFSSWVKCALVSRGWSSVSIFEQTSQRRKGNPRPLLLAVGFTSGVSPPPLHARSLVEGWYGTISDTEKLQIPSDQPREATLRSPSLPAGSLKPSVGRSFVPPAGVLIDNFPV